MFYLLWNLNAETSWLVSSYELKASPLIHDECIIGVFYEDN